MRSLLLAVALIGCASEPDRIDPLLSETTGTLTFQRHSWQLDTFTYELDVPAQRLTGHRIVILDDQSLCRRRATAGSMAAPMMQRLGDVLAGAELITLGEDSCNELRSAGCGAPDNADISVRADGGELYSLNGGCRQLVAGSDLEVELNGAFGAVAGVYEQVEWNGLEFEVTGGCSGAFNDVATDL